MKYQVTQFGANKSVLYVRFQILKVAVMMMMMVFWVLMQYRSR